MTPTEALEWAADYAERSKIWEPPKDNRGYVKGNWTDPTPAEKVKLIKELAETVIDPQPMLTIDGTHQVAQLQQFIRDGILHNLKEARHGSVGADELEAHIDSIIAAIERRLKGA